MTETQEFRAAVARHAQVVTDLRVAIGQRLRQARLHSDMSAATAAECLCSGNVRHLERLEAGDREVMYGRVLRRAATLYDVKLEWLLGSEEPEQHADVWLVEAALALSRMTPAQQNRAVMLAREIGED